MKIARRNFISMMAAAPFVPALERWAKPQATASPTDPNQNFYVWVHGIFGITLQQSQILLVSPKLTDPKNNHVYKVGRVTKFEQTKTPNGVTGIFHGLKDLKEAATYSIEGLGDTAARRPKFNLDDRSRGLFVQGTAILDKKDTFYFALPYPDLLRPLRFSDNFPATAYKPPPATPVHNLPQGGLVPLTHVFEYQNVPFSKVRIMKGSKTFWGPRHSNNLHLFAEPDPFACDKCHDPQTTLNKLVGCYEGIPQFSIEPKSFDCPSLNNIFSFSNDLKEQFGLFEWAGQCREKPHPLVSGPESTRTTMDCPQTLVTEVPQLYSLVMRSQGD